MGTAFKLAARNLTRQKRRNAILAIAIAFGFFVVTTIDGCTSGMVDNLENQITQLLGGTVLLQGLEKIPEEEEGKKSQLVTIVRDRDYIKNIVETSNINYKSYSCYSTSTGQIIFEGQKSMIQLYGRDLSDKVLLDTFQFVEGSAENLSEPNALVISDKTAKSMNLAVGDEVIFVTTTIYGQNNVGDFKIAGIIKSNSFMNTLQSYADIDTVNKLIGIPEGGYSTFTIFLKNKNEQTNVAMMLENRIREDGKNVTSRLEAIKTNPSNIGKGIEKQLTSEDVQWEGTMYAVETLYDEIPQLVSVLLIVHVVTTIILIVILLIVMVGVSNTYRMILYERIREIGTMRSLGMTRKTTKRVFSLEAIILCLLGAVAGLLFAIIVMQFIHLVPFTNESLSFFLHNGHFTFTLSPVSIIIQYLLLILLTFLAVLGSSNKAAKMSPAEALRTVK